MKALATAFDVSIDSTDLAVWCQRVENRIVGAPCGIMDQMTSALGREAELLELECQPARILGNLGILRDVAFWGIDSGLRHAVTGSDYGSVRLGAFMGHRILCHARGLEARSVEVGHVTLDDPQWRGYLANVSPSEFQARYAAALPAHMSGEQFLARYGGIVDRVTTIDPKVTYPVHAPTAHPIWENHRVRSFAELLPSAASERVRELLGELMFQSHESYNACGLGSDGTDAIVDLVRAHGPAAGLYGAKISGGGSGGTVVVLGRSDAGGAVRAVARDYAERTGRVPLIFSGSSPGAAAFGTRTRPRSR
jgi:L-arabinokinase